MPPTTLFSLAAAAAAGEPPHLLWSIPFAILLLAIALMPFVNKHVWEHHYPKIAIALAIVPTVYYFLIRREPGPWLLAMEEYIGFIILLSALFIISGGIVIRVNRKATPLANSMLLVIGAILANIFGTTGAAMLLIRPYIHMNRGHIRPYHIVFFIFLVANCGGLLTPIGDPPLFLGYLVGIPFRWTLEHLWPIWLAVVGTLLAIFFIIDTLHARRLPRPTAPNDGPQVHILGIHNFVFIAVVIFAVFRPGVFETAERMKTLGWSFGHALEILFSREVLMALATIASKKATGQRIYDHNAFTYGPIREVAILFIAIFATMAPALGWLEANARKLEVRTPGAYYFTTGALSAFLDNAPTYLTFLKMRLGAVDPQQVQQASDLINDMASRRELHLPTTQPLDTEVESAVLAVTANHAPRILDGTIGEEQIRVGFLIGVPRLNAFIIAISAGAVLFGATTYIGNGPNFMVKSIAESANIPMPSFLTYLLTYSLPILVPLFAAIWAIFLR